MPQPEIHKTLESSIAKIDSKMAMLNALQDTLIATNELIAEILHDKITMLDRFDMLVNRFWDIQGVSLYLSMDHVLDDNKFAQLLSYQLLKTLYKEPKESSHIDAIYCSVLMIENELWFIFRHNGLNLIGVVDQGRGHSIHYLVEALHGTLEYEDSQGFHEVKIIIPFKKNCQWIKSTY